MPASIMAALALAAWVYLICARGGFWRGWREPDAPALSDTSAVAVVIPARDEAPLIGGTLRALFAQDYPGAVQIIVVDDHSSDGTAAVAQQAARDAGAAARLTLVPAPALPTGRAGQGWAMARGS